MPLIHKSNGKACQPSQLKWNVGLGVTCLAPITQNIILVWSEIAFTTEWRMNSTNWETTLAECKCWLPLRWVDSSLRRKAVYLQGYVVVREKTSIFLATRRSCASGMRHAIGSLKQVVSKVCPKYQDNTYMWEHEVLTKTFFALHILHARFLTVPSASTTPRANSIPNI